MIVRSIAATIAVTAALLVAPASANMAPPEYGQKVVSPGANDTNGEVTLEAGQTLVVKLPKASGTLASWALDGDAGPELQAGETRTEIAPGRALGRPQLQVFEFLAAAAGSKELTFNLATPNGDVAKTYSLSVTVSEP